MSGGTAVGRASSGGLHRLPLPFFVFKYSSCPLFCGEDRAGPCAVPGTVSCRVRFREQTCRSVALAGTVVQRNETYLQRLEASSVVKTAWEKGSAQVLIGRHRCSVSAGTCETGPLGLSVPGHCCWESAGTGKPPRVCWALGHVRSIALREEGLRLPSLCPRDKDAFEAGGAGDGCVGSPPVPVLGRMLSSHAVACTDLPQRPSLVYCRELVTHFSRAAY